MRPRMTVAAVLVAATQLLWSSPVRAAVYDQPPAVSAFTITGFIQSMTLDSIVPTGNPGADVLGGGTVTVNGIKVTIPRNTIVIMSASNITWQELWALAPCPWGLPTMTAVQAASLPAGAGACLTGGNGMTGLALSDVDPATLAKPLTPTEITILGNRIGNGTAIPDYVAGLVYMSQQSLNFGQGFINFIDYATGTLHVGGVPGKAGPACSPTTALGAACETLIQLNDPVGRYGRLGGNNSGASPDPRWTADTDNPTIHAKTGYPMCIPRTTPAKAVVAGAAPNLGDDPLCPQRNRPLDPANTAAPLGNFTLCNPGAIVNGADPNPSNNCRANLPPAAPGVINALATVVPGSDATNQAPFMVGDYIEWSGTLQVDATGTFTGSAAGQQYVSAHTLVANLGIYTSPLAVPAYLEEELTILGTGGTPITAPSPVPEEVTTRIKARGFFTDPSRVVDLFAVQVDACSGAETEVLMLGAIPNQKGGVPWGRFRDVDQAGLFPITRQWRVKYTPAVTDPAPGTIPPACNQTAGCANGLTAMSFTLPVSVFITPENTVYGDPTLLVVPQNFQDFPFLAKGEGPYKAQFYGSSAIIGTLAPFPLTNSIPGLSPLTPSPNVCVAAPPTVVVTPPDQTVKSNSKVTLDASKSFSNPGGNNLAFKWQQIGTPLVTINTPNAATATFTAPNVTTVMGLTFQVTATDTTTGTSATGTTLINVAPKVVSDTVTITGATYRLNRGVLNVTATSSDVTCAAALTIQAFANGTLPLLPTNSLMTASGPVVGGCGYTFVTGKSLFPPSGTSLNKVTVISSEGGSDVCPNGTTCTITFK